MRSNRKRAFHRTAVAQKNAVFAEEQADFSKGERVMTVDGFPGRVTAVLFGPYPGTETYQVVLDNDLGGGDYSPGQLRPYSEVTASRVEASDVYASIPFEANTDHTANVDYPELEDILERRLPIENVQVFASRSGRSKARGYGHSAGYRYMQLKHEDPDQFAEEGMHEDPDIQAGRDTDEYGRHHFEFGEGWLSGMRDYARENNIYRSSALNTDKMAVPDAKTDDPTENMEDGSHFNDKEDNGADPVDEPEADPEVESDEDEDGEPKVQVGDVKPPDACSYCGNATFGDPQTTGRGVRMRCEQCGGTMVSWGGQWQPEFPNSSQNRASETWDYRSGGPGGVVQAPGANFKTTMLEATAGMSRQAIAESLQAQSGIVQWLFNRVYEKAREHYDAKHDEWWKPAPQEVGTNLEGPAYYTVEPKHVTVGSLSEYDDPEWKFHFTASWMDVQAKARRIRKENHVKIVSASKLYVVAEVKGDTATYETQLNYVPGSKRVADWSCGCKWASYAWGRSKRYMRFEGRLCSHALATQYEANSRGIFGREVEPDRTRPDWQKAHSPIVVQYDKAKDKNLTRRAVPPANMRRSFSSLILDSDGIYPEPQRLDLNHPPVYASVQTMFDHDANLVDVIEMLASQNIDRDVARSMVFEALLGVDDAEGYLGYAEAAESGSESHSGSGKGKHKHHHRQDHGRTWGYGFRLGWGPCGFCGGSGCSNCNGTGQVPASDPAAVGDGGAVDAGGDTGGAVGGDGGATASLHTADYSTADPLAGLDAGQLFKPTTPKSNSQNPASTGWATSQDPGDWGKSLISNDFGVTFDAALHVTAIEDFDFPEAHRVQEYDSGGRRMIDSPDSHTFPTREHAERYLDWLGRRHQEWFDKPMPEGKFQIHSPRPVIIEHEPRGYELPGRTIEGAKEESIEDLLAQRKQLQDSHTPGDRSAYQQRKQIVELERRIKELRSRTGAKQPEPPTVSGVALKANDTGRVLMIQRSNKDPKDKNAGKWEFPGGHHEEGDQTSLHAGIREWEEEVGQPFPQGGHVTHVHRSGPYLLHTVVVPDESSVNFGDGRATVNPDDPDGDDHEQSAWWDPDHACKNPALREECKKTPWNDIKKAAGTFHTPQSLHSCRYCGRPTVGRDSDHCETCEDLMGAYGVPNMSGGWRDSDEDGATLLHRSEPAEKYYTEHAVHSLSSLHEGGGKHYFQNPNQIEYSYGMGAAHGQQWAAHNDLADLNEAAKAHANEHEEHNPGMFYHYLEGFNEGAHLPPSAYHLSTLHEGPEGALPFTDGGEDDVVPDPLAGNTVEGPHGNSLFDTEASIIARFQQTTAGKSLAKEAMKDFTFEEQQALINEGRGDRARNFGDLRIEGTHYALIGDDIGDDETILWT